jgi:predicted nucleic acid-binding protein
MNGNRFLADTNTFIYLLSKHPSLLPLLDSEWVFSFITEIELLGKPAISKQEIEEINNLLSACVKSSHTDAINKTAIFLKQLYNIKIPDALIAATAIEQKIPLLTYDKDFIKIKEVDLVLLEP